MKKTICVLVCLLLALMPVWALASLRMPNCRGAVTDDANVLSAQTASDLAQYAERLENETSIALQVALVHFLDGAEVQSYANTLFDLWELDGDHLLVLGAAGEDRFATVAGSQAAQQLGARNAENLLYTSSEFAQLFTAQQYDAAFAAYCTALSALVEKQMNETVRLDGLFGQTAPSPVQQAQSYASGVWDDIMQSITDSSQDYYEHHEDDDNGLSAGGWILLILLVMVMLRRNKYEKQKRPGCMGWLFSLLGINFFMNFLRRRRH